MTTENAPALAPEMQVLMNAAQGIDAEAAAASAPPPAGDENPAATAAAVVVDPVAETAAIMAVVVGVLSPALPYLPAIYTEQRIQQIAAAFVPVADKYGWQTGGALFAKWGPEIGLALAVLPAAQQTMVAHKAWSAEREAQALKDGAMPPTAEAVAA